MDDARHTTHPEGPCTATESTELPETLEEDTWAKLKVAIDAVHTETTVAYNELCRVSGEDEPLFRQQLMISPINQDTQRVCVASESSQHPRGGGRITVAGVACWPCQWVRSCHSMTTQNLSRRRMLSVHGIFVMWSVRVFFQCHTARPSTSLCMRRHCACGTVFGLRRSFPLLTDSLVPHVVSNGMAAAFEKFLQMSKDAGVTRLAGLTRAQFFALFGPGQLDASIVKDGCVSLPALLPCGLHPSSPPPPYDLNPVC